MHSSKVRHLSIKGERSQVICAYSGAHFHSRLRHKNKTGSKQQEDLEVGDPANVALVLSSRENKGGQDNK